MALSGIYLAQKGVVNVGEEVMTFIQFFNQLIVDFWSALPRFSLFVVFVCACIVYWCASAVQSLMGG